MPPRGHNALEGMGELLLSLVWNHCNSQEWASWLKIILLGAARGSDAEMVLALIKAGAASSNLRSGDMTTPFHVAAQRGSLDVVSSLLKTSAIRDVNEKLPSNGRTPLYVAVNCGHAGVAFALARAGGNVNRAAAGGWSPLMCAAFEGRAGLVNDLLLWGAQDDAKGEDGDQALHVAVREDHLGVVKVLLRARACPGTRGEHLMSSLDWAAQYGDTDTLRELLASAPDLNIFDDGGKSAMCTAAENGRPEAIGMLVDAGVDVGSPLSNGKLPLQAACLQVQPSSVQALLRRNADETVRDGENELAGEIVGHGIPEEERDNDFAENVRDICKMLARAPADRVWRRRGWLAMLKARKRVTDKQGCQARCALGRANLRKVRSVVVDYARQVEDVWVPRRLALVHRSALLSHSGESGVAPAATAASDIPLLDFHLRQMALRTSTCLAHPKPPPTAVPITLGQQRGRKDHEDGAGNNQHHGVEHPSVMSSRRKPADGRKWTTGDDVVHVHPTRKKLHWIVTKMVHVADELVFRNIVSYL